MCSTVDRYFIPFENMVESESLSLFHYYLKWLLLLVHISLEER